MPAPQYHPASTVDDALALLRRPGARVIAGGTDLLVAMDAGLEVATDVVDITRASALADIGSRPSTDASGKAR